MLNQQHTTRNVSNKNICELFSLSDLLNMGCSVCVMLNHTYGVYHHIAQYYDYKLQVIYKTIFHLQLGKVAYTYSNYLHHTLSA